MDGCPLNASEDSSQEDIILEADWERPGAGIAVWKSGSQYNNPERGLWPGVVGSNRLSIKFSR